MPLMICDECDGIENTSYGNYWGRKDIQFADKSKNGKVLCRSCAPTHYKDGSLVTQRDHYLFEVRPATEDEVLRIGIDQFVYLGKFTYLINKKRSF